MEIITSKKNKIIQKLRSLMTTKGRAENHMFIAEGEHMVSEALNSGYKLDTLICSVDKAEKYSYLLQDRPCIYTSSDVFESISDTKSPQGICAVLRIDNLIESYGDSIVILNGVQDPGNVGTIIRTADAAGFSDVVMDNACADIYNPKTLRSTMGSIFHINCHRIDNLADFIKQLKEYSVYATALDGADYFGREKDNKKIAIIFGNEGNGVDKNIQDLATHRYALPMVGKAESLNVAVACGIMIYDIMRRKL